ncbi:MAG: hypothetical protein AAB652_00215 [Patescibacteria group bacterium]
MEESQVASNPSSIPAPPEVSVRTMTSDIEAMTRGGGTSIIPDGVGSSESDVAYAPPRPETFTLSGEPYKEPFATYVSPRAVIVVGIIAILIMAILIGYFFVYPFFIKLTVPPFNANPGSLTPAPTGIVLPPSSPPSVVTHETFFRILADRTIPFVVVKSPVSSVVDLQTYAQKLTGVINATGGTTGFYELGLADDAGKPLAASRFFDHISVHLFEPSFLDANFNPDFTAFVYKDRKGIWPGYVLGIKRGKTLSVVQNQIAKEIENSGDITSAFLTSPGKPSPGVFRDALFLDHTVRYFTFDVPGSVAQTEFSYSWFNDKFLVISTSRGGLEKAFEHLGR